MVPVAVSKVSPAGSAPAILKLVFVAPVEVIEVVTGVTAIPTVAFTVVTEVATAIGVTIIEVVFVAAPDPAAFVATADTEYSVPGVKPVIATGAEIAAAEVVAVPTEPDETGETVTVYESIAAPPVVVAAATETLAVVVEVALAETAAGAPGTLARTFIVTIAVPVDVAPPETVVDAVIV